MIPGKVNTPLRFAVIGCGMLAQATHIPALHRSPKARLQGCCDVSADVLALMREKYQVPLTCRDYREIIRHPEIDAIRSVAEHRPVNLKEI